MIELTRSFADIKRTVGYKEGHLENDAEHSYQLAVACWMANQQYELGLKEDLILKYALVHDLVEVYAGDVDPFVGDQKAIANKKTEEEKAYKRLKEEYSQFSGMLQAIDQYEKKMDPEAQLVYVLDKFLPDVNLYLSHDDFYVRNRITIQDWRKWLDKKIGKLSLDNRLQALVDESVHHIETQYEGTFWQRT